MSHTWHIYGSSERAHLIAARLGLACVNDVPTIQHVQNAQSSQHIWLLDHQAVQALLSLPWTTLPPIMDISGDWFGRQSARAEFFAQRGVTYLNCDGVFVAPGERFGFAFCVGGTVPQHIQSTGLLHALAPWPDAWSHTKSASGAGFLVLLIHAFQHIALTFLNTPQSFTPQPADLLQLLIQNTQLDIYYYLLAACSHYLALQNEPEDYPKDLARLLKSWLEGNLSIFHALEQAIAQLPVAITKTIEPKT